MKVRTEWISDPRLWGPPANKADPAGGTPNHPEDPLGPYIEPEFDEAPETASDAFRQWSHRNKKWVFGIMFGAVLLAFAWAMIGEQEQPVEGTIPAGQMQRGQAK